MEQIRLDGRVAIVTGGGTGLGRAHALALAGRGAAVVVNDVGSAVDGRGTSGVADVVVEEIVVGGGRAVANHDSVAERAGAQAMVDRALEAFGGVDILVANAGILRDAPWEDYAEQDFHDVLDVHLKGSFFVAQAAYRVMKERGYGRVVFTTSTSGLLGRPLAPAYAAAKAGILGLMNSLAIEGGAHGVKANAIAPMAYTRMNAQYFELFADRMPPELVSDLVVYLASEQCAITHEVIEAGLGRYARIFVGRAAGWLRDPGPGDGPEAVMAHLAEIRDVTRFVVPIDAHDDIRDLLE